MDVSYSLQDVPGKGKGLVASRAISRGELILSEAPLIQQDRSYSNASILRALAPVSEQQQREYFSLANAHKGNRSIPPPLGIFKTNALPCGDHSVLEGSAATHAAVFVLGSRFNSSCEPNVNNYWDANLQKITFWATRDIAIGEELCISYGECLASREARRSRLKRLFGFDCTCVACSRTGEDLTKSDERRLEIARLYEEIGQCGGAPAAGVRMVKRALRLLEEEGLLGLSTAGLYYDAFQFCVSVADSKNAKAWASKAWDTYCAMRGPDSEAAKKMHKYLKDPRAHLAFGLYPRQKLSGPD
ncbi:hypothetical protein BN946_scf184844.g134 [Trametes cinnabarina]|uniref:SET domain-containing protein n=1 Tax=Pycnoporus cinnabarinus TaxID=5643 RepID=A0A060S9V7_PYCCI|nr:hypothetical protein BN946_scf184844.g134 [Trametes cinnabarina]